MGFLFIPLNTKGCSTKPKKSRSTSISKYLEMHVLPIVWGNGGISDGITFPHHGCFRHLKGSSNYYFVCFFQVAGKRGQLEAWRHRKEDQLSEPVYINLVTFLSCSSDGG